VSWSALLESSTMAAHPCLCTEKVVSWATVSWEQGIGLWSVYEELWTQANSSSQEQKHWWSHTNTHTPADTHRIRGMLPFQRLKNYFCMQNTSQSLKQCGTLRVGRLKYWKYCLSHLLSTLSELMQQFLNAETKLHPSNFVKLLLLLFYWQLGSI